LSNVDFAEKPLVFETDRAAVLNSKEIDALEFDMSDFCDVTGVF
jgi:hypothetical protein